MAILVSALAPYLLNKIMPELVPTWLVYTLDFVVSVYVFYYARNFFRNLKDGG
jgi:hypothetical protein